MRMLGSKQPHGRIADPVHMYGGVPRSLPARPCPQRRALRDYSQASRTPVTGQLAHVAGERRTTLHTLAVAQPPFPELIPVALDRQRPATSAVGALTIHIVDVAGIDVLETAGLGLFARTAECIRRRVRNIGHLVI